LESMDDQQLFGNFILNSLPPEESERLRSHLKRVMLTQGDKLVGVREPITQVYFPVTAIVSWMNSTTEGDTVEIGLTGFEGMVGTTLLLSQQVTPWEVCVQLTGEAFQMSASSLLELLPDCPVLRQKMGNFAYLKMMHLTQSALCNRFHAIEQRLCRWLLEADDRAKTSELRLTRDTLANMIGSTRPAVSLVTGTLRAAGLIRTTRGQVTILDRAEMEEASCECYHIVKQQFDAYLVRDRRSSL
jgi:CRP-like cAMP-binding protein